MYLFQWDLAMVLFYFFNCISKKSLFQLKNFSMIWNYRNTWTNSIHLWSSKTFTHTSLLAQECLITTVVSGNVEVRNYNFFFFLIISRVSMHLRAPVHLIKFHAPIISMAFSYTVKLIFPFIFTLSYKKINAGKIYSTHSETTEISHLGFWNIKITLL